MTISSNNFSNNFLKNLSANSPADLPTDLPTDLPANQKNLRTIKSFVRREGRLTPSQARALDQLYLIYGIDLNLELNKNFKNNNPLVLEIGFGMGDSLIQMAKDNPDLNYLGLEVHRPGVGHILLGIEQENKNQENLTNLKVLSHDAVEILEKYIPNNYLQKIQIFFPDPWHKKKHHKRRLIQEEFVKKLVLKLKNSGQIHLATDWENYAEQMLKILGENQDLSNIYGLNNFAPNQEITGRPSTKFQKRGENLGHGVWDLIFQKN